MPTFLALALFLTTAYPVWRAWYANRHTSLLAAVNWAISGWTIWGMFLIAVGTSGGKHALLLRYLALCVTGCAGVAVLGARRPGVTAWNFVVLALLAVHLLPVAEGVLTGTGLNQDGFRLFFVSATLAVGILNYLPTRLAGGALLALLGTAHEIWHLAADPPTGSFGEVALTAIWLVLASWAGWLGMQASTTNNAEFDTIWFDFRDRFGLVWGQRLREQFNRSALHAGWPVVLRWQGLRLRRGEPLPDGAAQTAMVGTLRALMKRFGPEESDSPAGAGP